MKRIKILDSLTESESLKTRTDNQKLINFGIGDTAFITPYPIIEATQIGLGTNKTHYTDSKGIVELREAISSYLQKFDIPSTLDDIIITPGAMQAVFYSLFIHVEEGTKVGLFEPAWLAYNKIIKVCGGIPVFCSLKNNRLTITALEVFIENDVKVIIINNPTNPTGKVWEKKELDILVNYCKENKVLLISDEVYNEIVYDKKFISIGQYKGINSIVIGSFSKVFSMTGWRLGYIYSKNKKNIDRINKLQQITATCPNSFVQYGAIDFEAELSKIQTQVAVYKRNRDLLYKTLSKINLKPLFPDGTFYMWVNVGMDGKKFAEKVYNDYGIVVVPGKAYGNDTQNFIRISYALPTEKVIRACKRLKDIKWVDAYKKLGGEK